MSTTAPFATDPRAAIAHLITLICPDVGMARELAADFEDAECDPDVGAETEGAALMWALKEAGDWKAVFYVDWNDTASFVQSVDALCELRGVALDWGCDDPLADEFLNEQDVPALVVRAHEALALHGLILWSWDTEGDCYSGFITHRADEGEVRTISRCLGVEFRAGDEDSF